MAPTDYIGIRFLPYKLTLQSLCGPPRLECFPMLLVSWSTAEYNIKIFTEIESTNDNFDEDDEETNVAGIIGGAIGGVVAIFVMIVCCVICCVVCQKKDKVSYIY